MSTAAPQVAAAPARRWIMVTAGGRKPPITAMKLPAVVLLLAWSIGPLIMTLWFSFRHFNLLDADRYFSGLENYKYLLTDDALAASVVNTLILVVAVLAITVGLGTLLAVLLDQDFWGRGIARVLMIAPFFVMPTVSALVWKNLLMHPVNGLFGFLLRSVGLQAIDWFADYPLTAIIIMVAWQWLPFATLILLTSVQALDPERKEAARMDGAGPISMFFFIIIPHLARSIGVVIMIEMLFLLSIFAEIFVTTSGGPGNASTNLPFLIYRYALLDFDVGGASAGGVLAIILANIVAIFLMRSLAKSIEA
ncbi:MAG TPA: sugar ABC transporter permease [Anaeromyxobacteraceae bacterium]|nr:sugar ABC transporter permease [Anaeromyxobacteraceae bacterium]